ncbi:uncharacterized protein FTOL_08210 [Fusarium torulosum]|uniref:Uncharacterized protein n=1 Tax=Fusarium torulosum TaxID=33205 RepID=A0AAE8MCA6_9HYPO|nr:uncharacterized protein FTOL_08210 [Fusarium torulosum]
MSTKRRITDLPLEIRQQIFGDHFKVQGGYIYDVKVNKLRNADNTPIDLSLIYTCRLIANDCKHLPLAVNAVHFSTPYREDWRSLAGCFNLAATYYNALQQDLVLHLAHLVTPEMHAQLEKRFPTFRSKLEAERKFHFFAWDTGDNVEPAEDTDTSEHVRPAVCQFVQEFYANEISILGARSPSLFHGYYTIDQQLQYYVHPTWPDGAHMDACDTAYRSWNRDSGEVDQCLTHCLRLIADKNPKEFAARVYVCLQHWDGKYPAEDFFNLRFEHWAIPSRSQVAHVLNLLGVPGFVWKLPDTWSYDLDFVHSVGNNASPGHFPEEYNHPTVDFELRVREKVRFSAASAAIRFLDSLTRHQRTQIRMITIHEDLPAVNNTSLHGLGLVPFLQENPLLRVQRRVSVVHCVMDISYIDPGDIDDLLSENRRWYLDNWLMFPKLSHWLLDALAVANAGISPESFTLLLESGTDADFCTEAFEQLVHRKIAMSQAWDACMESGLLRTALERAPVQLSPEREKTRITREVAVGEAFQGAIMQLVNQTPTTLRCDFNPGLPKNHHIILDEMRAHPEGLWHYWNRYSDRETTIPVPDYLKTREILAQYCDIQTREEYLQSQERDHE